MDPNTQPTSSQTPLNPTPPESVAPAPEPSPDMPDMASALGDREEIVDPTTPLGNAKEVIIRRHPFGLAALYLSVIVGLGGGLALIFFLINSVLTEDTRPQADHWLIAFGGIAAIFLVFVLVIATAVYRANRWVVTDDSISQVLQKSLFSRQTSELSMANIEDVTAEQRGLLATLFNFGTLKVETAGELPYFHFIYCPRPNAYAQVILHARERFINENPEAAKRANDLLNVPRYPRQ